MLCYHSIACFIWAGKYLIRLFPCVVTVMLCRSHYMKHQHRVFFNILSNLELLWFYFTMLCDWFKTIVLPTQPIRCKTKTNHDLVTHVFPCLAPVTCSCFELSLAHLVIYVCCDWPLSLLWFWFYDTQMRTLKCFFAFANRQTD